MKKISLISSTGGHWTQLNTIYNEFVNDSNSKGKYDIQFITEKNNTNKNRDNIRFLIQQDRKNTLFIFHFFLNILLSFYYVITYKPNYVISTGAGATLPYIFIAKMFGAKIIFIESFAKVNSPTMTGKIVYKIADVFFVQWPEMINHYPKAQYKGSLY